MAEETLANLWSFAKSANVSLHTVDIYSMQLFFVIRLNDETVCVKIYANGEKFDIGAGEQFNSVNELILHYKEHPLKTDKGVDIHLDEVN